MGKFKDFMSDCFEVTFLSAFGLNKGPNGRSAKDVISDRYQQNTEKAVREAALRQEQSQRDMIEELRKQGEIAKDGRDPQRVEDEKQEEEEAEREFEQEMLEEWGEKWREELEKAETNAQQEDKTWWNELDDAHCWDIWRQNWKK